MKTRDAIAFIFLTQALVACGQSSFDIAPPAPSTKPSAKLSKLSISDPNFANGITPADITIKIVSEDALPLAGITMTLIASGSENVLVPCTPSDAQGISRCRLYSTKPELKSISANGEIVLTAETVFTKVQPSTSTMAIVTSGSADRLPTGERLITTSGIVESSSLMVDTTGNVRAKSSIQASIFGN